MTAEKEHSETVEMQEGSTGLSWTPEEEKKLVRKIDLLLLPTIWIMYLLSYMSVIHKQRCQFTATNPNL